MSNSTINVLAVETATKGCSAALIYKGKEYARFEELPQKHAHKILPMIEALLKEADIAASEIDLLSFGEGPGAFTGIRIAAGVVQGLALGLDKPVIGISSLAAVAEQMFADNVFTDVNNANQTKVDWCVLLDARMNEVYLLSGTYDVQTKKLEFSLAELISPDLAAEKITQLKHAQKKHAQNNSANSLLLGAGDIECEYPQLCELFDQWQNTLPQAISVARLAIIEQAEHENAKLISEQIPAPVYLRNQIADTIEERKKKAMLKSK